MIPQNAQEIQAAAFHAKRAFNRLDRRIAGLRSAHQRFTLTGAQQNIAITNELNPIDADIRAAYAAYIAAYDATEAL